MKNGFLLCLLVSASAISAPLQEVSDTVLSTGPLSFLGDDSFSASFDLVDAGQLSVVLTGGDAHSIILGRWSAGEEFGDVIGVAGGTAVWHTPTWAPGPYTIVLDTFALAPLTNYATYEWRIEGARMALQVSPAPEPSMAALVLAGLSLQIAGQWLARRRATRTTRLPACSSARSG